MTDQMHINWDIIVRRILGDSSGEENELVEKWLAENELNREYYRKAKRYFDVYYTGEETREVDAEGAWDEFVTYAGKSSRRSIWRTVVKYAAAVIVLIGVGITYMMLKDQPQVVVTVAENQALKPGVTKAVLEFHSGRRVALTDSSVLERVVEEHKQQKDGTGGENTQRTGEYNTIIVPRGGEYNLLLADGTSVKMNSDSRLSFPEKFVGKDRRVRLTGEAFFRVTKDAEHPFIVETDGGEVRVLGTEFNVSAYLDEKCVKTTLVTGKIAFLGTGGSDSVVLVPGEQVSYDKSTGESVVMKVDPKIYTAWIDGQWVIEGQRLEDIMKQLSRWYDVAVFYQNTEAKDLVFTGDLEKYNDCGVVLDIISMTTNVKFEVKGRVVTVKM